MRSFLYFVLFLCCDLQVKFAVHVTYVPYFFFFFFDGEICDACSLPAISRCLVTTTCSNSHQSTVYKVEKNCRGFIFDMFILETF